MDRLSLLEFLIIYENSNYCRERIPLICNQVHRSSFWHYIILHKYAVYQAICFCHTELEREAGWHQVGLSCRRVWEGLDVKVNVLRLKIMRKLLFKRLAKLYDTQLKFTYCAWTSMLQTFGRPVCRSALYYIKNCKYKCSCPTAQNSTGKLG